MPQLRQDRGVGMPHVAWPPTGSLYCQLCPPSRQEASQAASALAPTRSLHICTVLPAIASQSGTGTGPPSSQPASQPVPTRHPRRGPSQLRCPCRGQHRAVLCSEVSSRHMYGTQPCAPSPGVIPGMHGFIGAACRLYQAARHILPICASAGRRQLICVCLSSELSAEHVRPAPAAQAHSLAASKPTSARSPPPIWVWVCWRCQPGCIKRALLGSQHPSAHPRSGRSRRSCQHR